MANTKEHGQYVHRLHALELATGSEKPASPVVIAARVPGHASDAQAGEVVFDSKMHWQRPALLLSLGKVYVAFASHGDQTPYHGWVMSYDAQTLQQADVFNTSPDAQGAGVWHSGQGPAATPEGDVFVVAGNGIGLDPDDARNFGEALLRLRANLTVSDWFIPLNWQDLDDADADFGTTGPLLVGDRVIAGGKDGNIYNVNATRMGRVTDDAAAVQKINISPSRVSVAPVYWNGTRGPELFAWGSGGTLQALSFRQGQVITPPSSQSNTTANGITGGALSLSAHGTDAGIVWANTDDGLHAFDARNVSHELWNSNLRINRDYLGPAAKFVAPTISHGRVYVPNHAGELVVYGINPSATERQITRSGGRDDLSGAAIAGVAVGTTFGSILGSGLLTWAVMKWQQWRAVSAYSQPPRTP